jgi:hypothetical protein
MGKTCQEENKDTPRGCWGLWCSSRMSPAGTWGGTATVPITKWQVATGTYWHKQAKRRNLWRPVTCSPEMLRVCWRCPFVWHLPNNTLVSSDIIMTLWSVFMDASILWHNSWKPEQFNTIKRLLLSNYSVNTFPWQHRLMQQWKD